MKVAKALLVLIAAAVLLVGAGALWLPKTWRVQSSVAIRTNTSTLAPYVSDLRQWHGWAVWIDPLRDPSAKFDFQGDGSAAAKQMRWRGKRIGEGSLELVAADRDRGIRYRGTVGACVTRGTISFAPEGQTVRVTWTEAGDAGYHLVARLRLSAIRSREQARLAGSLERLKDLAQQTLRPPGRAPTHEVMKFDSHGNLQSARAQ